MGEFKGERLYVDLSASQVRRRLKGFGHGVRKVQSAGRNRAVVIHTATGRHRRELEALFADCLTAACEPAPDTPLENLRNLGPVSAGWLRAVGVHSRADLQRFGPALAYRLVKQTEPSAGLNLLWALAGALADQDWRELSEERKQQLLERVRQVDDA